MKESLKVLIADDSDMNLKLFEALVKSFGFECKTALNGQLAFEIACKESFDIVLMDVEMPVLDGKKSLLKIKNEINKNLPVIALTAHKNIDKLNELLEAGFDDYLVKPFTKSDLNNIILTNHNKKGRATQTPVSTNSDNGLYNLKYLTEMADNDKDLLIQLLDVFMKLVPVALQSIKELYKSENFELLYIEAHKFSSQLIFIGAKQTSEYAASIEKSAKEKIDTHQIPQWINILESECNLIIEDLQTKFFAK